MLKPLALLCLLAAPAQAECLTYLSFAKGVEVRLADGSTWLARRNAHEVIRLDEVGGKGAYARYVEGPFGVYPTESTRNGQDATSEYRYARTPEAPVAGMNWTSNVRVTLTAMGATKPQTQREKVHVTATTPTSVKLGSCSYPVLEIDMGHLGGPYPTVQRFTYFPDLRFGIQTRITYPADTVKKSAIVAMRAK